MFARLLLLFIVVPLLEMAILIQLGSVLGFWPTFGLVVVTGVLGAVLARSQGTRVFGDIRAELAAGQVPTGKLMDGFLVLVGGIVLLTPGVLTDLLGLALLFPPTRNRMKAGLRRRFEGMVQSGQVRVTGFIGG